MNCPNCNGIGQTIRTKVRFSGWRWRRIQCQDCKQRWSENFPPGDHPPTHRMGRLTEDQIVLALTTHTRSRELAKRWEVSQSLIEQVRRRVIYKEVRPDLPQWQPKVEPATPLRDELIEWLLLSPLSHAAAAKLVDRSPRSISRIRQRGCAVYKHVRPDLPLWHEGAPWLIDQPIPEEPGAVPERACFDCLHFGGLNLPCTIHNPPLAAMECPEFTPDTEEDDDAFDD
jgi:hypothetical protein